VIKKVLTGLAAALAISGAVQAQELKEINFGIISTESSQNLKSQWQPILADMEKKTGLKVHAFFASDYAGIIEGMRFNKVQVAWFGNKSAMEAVDRANGEIFAQMLNDDGTKGYYSHLIVNKDSNLHSLQDVLKNAKSLSFGNGDPNSTSGFLVPSYYVFAQNHVDPKSAFKVVRTSNHESNALAVANKQVDVATNNSEQMQKMKDGAPDKFAQIRIVWTSPLIPSDPIVIRKDLPEATKKKVEDFFYGYGATPEEKDNLMKLNKLAGFRPSTNAQLTPIRQLELFKERNKVESDADLAAADKQAKLAEIDKKLADLNKL
jgi:phosphonate transport system substrate-binding protein